MTHELFVEALRTNEAVILFPSEKELKKAVKSIGFYTPKPSYISFQLYSYKGIPLRTMKGQNNG